MNNFYDSGSGSDLYSSKACEIEYKPYAGTIILNIMISSKIDLIMFGILTVFEIVLLFYQIEKIIRYSKIQQNNKNIDKELIILNILNIAVSYMYIFTFTFYISAYIFRSEKWIQMRQNFPFAALQMTESLQLFLIYLFYKDQYQNEYGNQNKILIQILNIANSLWVIGTWISCIPALVFNFCLGSIQIMNYFKLIQCGTSIFQTVYFFLKEYYAKRGHTGSKDIIIKKNIYLSFILASLLAIVTFYIIRTLDSKVAFYIKFQYDPRFPDDIGLLENFNIYSPYDIKNNYIWLIVFTLYITIGSLIPRLLIIQINTSSSTIKEPNYSMQKIEN